MLKNTLVMGFRTTLLIAAICGDLLAFFPLARYWGLMMIGKRLNRSCAHCDQTVVLEALILRRTDVDLNCCLRCCHDSRICTWIQGPSRQ